MKKLIWLIFLMSFSAFGQNYIPRINIEGVGDTSTDQGKNNIKQFKKQEFNTSLNIKKFNNFLKIIEMDTLIDEFNQEIKRYIELLGLREVNNIEKHLLSPHSTIIMLEWKKEKVNDLILSIPYVEIRNDKFNYLYERRGGRNSSEETLIYMLESLKIKTKNQLLNLANHLEMNMDDFAESINADDRTERKNINEKNSGSLNEVELNELGYTLEG